MCVLYKDEKGSEDSKLLNDKITKQQQMIDDLTVQLTISKGMSLYDI